MLAELFADQREDAHRHLVTFEQAAKLQQRGGIGRLTLDQVDAHEATHRDAVDDGIFNSFVRQAQAVLAQIHAQHRFQPDRRTTALTAVVVRLN